MGYIRHHAIVVTGTFENHIEAAHAKASELSPNVSKISPVGIDNTRSFFIPPDGSKEGWADSDAGDERRRLFKRWLVAQVYEDGSSPLDWCEVWYGGDGDTSGVISHSRGWLKE